MFDIQHLIRDNVKKLSPYSSARDEYSGTGAVFLDANENPFDTGYNRYPDPYQRQLKEKIAGIKNVPANSIFLGNGSDEAIDLIIRAFCEPGKDNVITMPPTYGMYKVAAGINDIKNKEIVLQDDFQIDVNTVLASIDENTKLIFVCSPNNPTGNCMKENDIIALLNNFNGLVIVDEAYIDFCDKPSLKERLRQYSNLIVLQTFSKAWGLAGIRLGMAFADAEIIQVINKIKPPYNVNRLTQEMALQSLQNSEKVQSRINEILHQRAELTKYLKSLPIITKVYPTDANFILVKTGQARQIYQALIEQNVVIRDRSTVALCSGCLRITVGTPEQNEQLKQALEAV